MRRLNNNYRSIMKGVERAKKLKDLEIAKDFEINNIDIKKTPTKSKELETPVVRSNLPKE